MAFHEITPNRNSFQWTEDEPEPEIQRLPSNERTPVQHRSLLRQQFEEHGKQLPETAVHDDSEDLEQGDSSSTAHHIGSPSRDIFSHASHLTGPFSASFGGVYGSLSSRVNDTSREHAARLYLDQQATGAQEPDKEREPLLLRRVEEDGKVSIEVVGQSTVYQTILNSTNVLIGIGLLSLPLGIKYAGWIIGVLFLTAAAGTTAYTARLLGKCLDIDRNMITYADIASVAFGWKAQFVITVIFMLELSAACVALFVLFADSLNILFPWGGVTEYKYLCGFIMVPLSFVPLRLLGYSSSLGIICCITSG